MKKYGTTNAYKSITGMMGSGGGAGATSMSVPKPKALHVGRKKPKKNYQLRSLKVT